MPRAKPATRSSAPPSTSSPLPARQARFVEEYLVDANATQAAIRAGYSVKTADVQGPRLLGNVGVAAAIARGQAARSERTQITADLVIERFWAIATADPRELIEYRRSACRYCLGIDHLYHRTAAEMAKARLQYDRDRLTWEEAQKKSSKAEYPAFSEEGGIGYNPTKRPHPECPECFGEGTERAFVHDTRTLSATALCLYAGVKVTKDGIEVKMHDQHAALVNVGRHLGMFDEKPETPEDAESKARRIRAELDAMDATTMGRAA